MDSPEYLGVTSIHSQGMAEAAGGIFTAVIRFIYHGF